MAVMVAGVAFSRNVAFGKRRDGARMERSSQVDTGTAAAEVSS